MWPQWLHGKTVLTPSSTHMNFYTPFFPPSHFLSLHNSFQSTLVITAVETQRPQLSMQSAALITLFHNCSKREPRSQMTPLKISLFTSFSLSILFHSLSKNLSKSFVLTCKPFPTPSLLELQERSVTDAVNFSLAEHHTALRLPRVTLKSIKTCVMKLTE